MMTIPVKIKRSGTASSTPSSLDHGELAINYADATLFWKDSSNTIQSFVFQAYASATHKSTHATGGSDALTPGDIGAAPAASPAITGNATFEASSGVPVTITNTGTGNSFVVNDASGDTTPFVVDSDGRVGIGVSDFSNFSTSFDDLVVGNGVGSRGLTVYAGDNSTGTVAFAESTTENTSRGYIQYTYAGVSTGPHMRFGLEGSEKIRLTATGFGVGRTAPASALDVNGVITVSAGTAAAPAIVASGDSNTGAFFPAADTFAISTAGSERLRVKSGGVVRYIPLTADPASGEAGDVYYNSTLQKLRVYNGSRWVSLHGAAWDISTARYVQEFSVAAQETGPQSICFRPDGTKLYLLGSNGDDVNQYDLSVPWDISTASYIQNFSVASQDQVPQGLFFRADGLKMFMAGSQTDAVYEYTLSTAWDISTASYASNSFSVAAQETQPTGVFFKPDGTKMFTVGVISDYVDEYDLSTAWDISTAVLGHSHLVQGQEGAPHDIFFSPNGLRMFIVGDAGAGVDEYILGEAWELSEITSNPTHAQFRSVASEDVTPLGLAFSPDGLNFYIVGATNDKIYQYRLS